MTNRTVEFKIPRQGSTLNKTKNDKTQMKDFDPRSTYKSGFLLDADV
jgi:hypothetical protein